jgi:hypothetical protein
MPDPNTSTANIAISTLLGSTVVEDAETCVIQDDPDLPVKPLAREEDE